MSNSVKGSSLEVDLINRIRILSRMCGILQKQRDVCEGYQISRAFYVWNFQQLLQISRNKSNKNDCVMEANVKLNKKASSVHSKGYRMFQSLKGHENENSSRNNSKQTLGNKLHINQLSSIHDSIMDDSSKFGEFSLDNVHTLKSPSTRNLLPIQQSENFASDSALLEESTNPLVSTDDSEDKIMYVSSPDEDFDADNNNFGTQNSKIGIYDDASRSIYSDLKLEDTSDQKLSPSTRVGLFSKVMNSLSRSISSFISFSASPSLDNTSQLSEIDIDIRKEENRSDAHQIKEQCDNLETQRGKDANHSFKAKPCLIKHWLLKTKDFKSLPKVTQRALLKVLVKHSLSPRDAGSIIAQSCCNSKKKLSNTIKILSSVFVKDYNVSQPISYQSKVLDMVACFFILSVVIVEAIELGKFKGRKGIAKKLRNSLSQSYDRLVLRLLLLPEQDAKSISWLGLMTENIENYEVANIKLNWKKIKCVFASWYPMLSENYFEKLTDILFDETVSSVKEEVKDPIINEEKVKKNQTYENQDLTAQQQNTNIINMSNAAPLVSRNPLISNNRERVSYRTSMGVGKKVLARAPSPIEMLVKKQKVMNRSDNNEVEKLSSINSKVLNRDVPMLVGKVKPPPHNRVEETPLCNIENQSYFKREPLDPIKDLSLLFSESPLPNALSIRDNSTSSSWRHLTEGAKVGGKIQQNYEKRQPLAPRRINVENTISNNTKT